MTSQPGNKQLQYTYCPTFREVKAIPVDTGRKLNVHKTFRRRPGRLLNVLCTFNLRPVSAGMSVNVRNIFLQKVCGNEAGISFCFLKKVKASVLHVSFKIFRCPSIWTYNKNKMYKNSYCWSRYMLNFDSLEKGLGLISPQHFGYDFSRKMFFMSYSINLPNFIIWLSLLLDISGNMCIVIICFPVCDVIILKIA